MKRSTLPYFRLNPDVPDELEVEVDVISWCDHVSDDVRSELATQLFPEQEGNLDAAPANKVALLESILVWAGPWTEPFRVINRRLIAIEAAVRDVIKAFEAHAPGEKWREALIDANLRAVGYSNLAHLKSIFRLARDNDTEFSASERGCRHEDEFFDIAGMETHTEFAKIEYGEGDHWVWDNRHGEFLVYFDRVMVPHSATRPSVVGAGW